MNRSKIFLWLFTLILLSACANEELEQQKRIHNYVEKRLKSHTNFKQQKCHDNILKAAINAVDKYILNNEELILARKKTTSLPPRPTRPVVKKISDSLKIAPIIEAEAEAEVEAKTKAKVEVENGYE